MTRLGIAPLGPFAVYVLPPTWVGGQPRPADRTGVAWRGLGLRGVPITARRDGFLIFEFNESADYAGGAVPDYTLPEDRRIPQSITRAQREREDLAYRRFVYMNAFLLALSSGFSTVQKTAMGVQEPVDPTNYVKATLTEDRWNVFAGKKVDYPLERANNIDIRTLDHVLGLIQHLDAAIENSVEILSLIYIACHQYSRHQFSSAHLIAWAVIEVLLNIMWVGLWTEIDVASGGHTQMNKERKKLLSGRDYTASVVSQILSISQKIDDQMLKRLDEARRKRNDFAHKLAAIDSGEAGKAIRLATDMITRMGGVPVTSQLTMSFWL